MTNFEYMDHAEILLKAIEKNCDRINDENLADVDNQRTGGMITLIFTNKSQIVINLQKPLHEIWLAAKSGGYHFQFDRGNWRDTKDHSEFFMSLSRYASEQSGCQLLFSA